jgi:hypothetical protein
LPSSVTFILTLAVLSAVPLLLTLIQSLYRSLASPLLASEHSESVTTTLTSINVKHLVTAFRTFYFFDVIIAENMRLGNEIISIGDKYISGLLPRPRMSMNS